MKNTIRGLCSTALICMELFLNGMLASAVVTDTHSTIGKVNFSENSMGEVVRPGTETPVTPVGGSRGSGPLRLEWVPDFDFGDLNIKATGQVAPVKWMKYKPNTANAVGDPAYNTPHFIQVTDERGLNNGKWIVKVSATKFKTGVSDPIQHTLNATAIELGGKTVTNNTMTPAQIGENFTVPTITGLSRIPISTNSASPTVLVQTAVGKVSSASKTSFVFQNNYVETAYSVASPQIGTGYDGAVLKIPSSDSPKKANYTSTITWTLEDTF